MQSQSVSSTSRMRFVRLVVGAAVACASGPTLATGAPKPHWAVDPSAVGEQLPTVGRSLFDFLVTDEKNGKREYNVPFPYAALIQKIEQRLHGDDGDAQVKQVLIPLGRSLQRNAAAPDFFKFPRVVAAIDTEAGPRGDSRMLLKDRVYIGFGEKSAVLEVISYNEAAGRFEFQVVNDYRPGGTPRVAYADRAVCMSCHQNAALVFSRQNWDETNANPEIARLLKKEGASFHGVPVERGVDLPFAIDEATNRANLFAVTQLLWSDGCGDGVDGDRCRAAAFGLALQYRLSGERAFAMDTARAQLQLSRVFVERWKTHWPGGLLIPDPDLRDRDPLRYVVSDDTKSPPLNDALDPKGRKLLNDLLANTDIQAAFEPLVPRDPLETWMAGDANTIARFVRGLAEFIAVNDAQLIDAHLAKTAAAAPMRVAKSQCTVAARAIERGALRLAFTCAAKRGAAVHLAGRVYANAGKITAGTIDAMDVDGATLNALEIGPESRFERAAGGWTLTLIPRQSHMRARTGNGAAIRDIVMTGRGVLSDDDVAAAAQVNLTDDFDAVWNAIDTALKTDRDAFSPKPFRRAVVMPALFANLSAAPRAWCCVDTTGMPPIVDDRLTPVSHAKN